MPRQLCIEVMLGTNYAPNHEDALGIQQVIADKQSELHLLADELSRSRAYAKDLCEKRRELQKRLNDIYLPEQY